MTLELVPITKHAANAFIKAHHRHSKQVRGCRFCLGAIHDGELVGIAVVGRPVSRHMDDPRTAEVTRVCTIEQAPKGTCSFLYARAWRAWQALGGKRMITYTLASESGSSLRGCGWKVLGESKPSKGWERERSRPGRQHQDVYAEPKLRWHAEASGPFPA